MPLLNAMIIIGMYATCAFAIFVHLRASRKRWKSNDLTYEQRTKLLDAIEAKSESRQETSSLLEMFRAVSYDQHRCEILAGRDPWALYHPRLLATLRTLAAAEILAADDAFHKIAGDQP